MDDHEKIAAVSDELAELKMDIRVAKNTLKGTIAITTVLLFIFFGVTYAKLEDIVDESIQKLVENKALTAATEKVKAAAATTIRESAQASTSIKDASTEAIDEIDSAKKQVIKNVEDTRELFAKLDGFVTAAEDRVGKIEQQLENVNALIPNLENLSVAGNAKNGDFIKVPWGTIADWNILISPKAIGVEQNLEDSNTTLLSVFYDVKVHDPETWRIISVSRHKFGQSIKTYPGEVAYLIIPKGRKNAKND